MTRKACAVLCLAAFALSYLRGGTPASFREYLECDGNQYIDTDIKPDKTTRVAMKFSSNDTTHDKMLFGVRNNGYAFLCWIGTTAGTKFTPAIGSSGNISGKDGNTAGEVADFDMSANGLFVNGAEVFSAANFSSYVNSSVSTKSLIVFGMMTGGNLEARKFYGKCYGVSIWHGGELVRRYVPCVDTEGVACMYECLSGTCVYSSGTQFAASETASEEGFRVVDGAVQYLVSAHGVESVVSIDGGTPATDVQKWVARGSEVALVANPSLDGTFSFWDGDISSFTSGDATSPAVSATVLQPISLRAVSRMGSLVVSSNTILHESVTCGGICFTGGYTLSSDDGVKVTIQDYGSGIEVKTGSASIACPVDFGTTSDGAEQTIKLPSGTVLSQTGRWGGKADLRLVGVGNLQLRGDNTFDGNVTLTNGLVDVYSDNAFGSTVGSTSYNYNNNGWHMIFHGVTTPESFTVKSNDKSSIVKFASGTTNVFLGPIKGSTNERWTMDANTKVVFSNTVDGIGCWCLGIPSTGKVEFWKNTTHGNLLYFSGSGAVYWHAPAKMNGSDTSGGFRVDGNIHYLCCTNATSYKNEAGWTNPGNNASRIDLCGNDQRARWLQSGSSITVVKSDDAATLHLLNATASITNTYAGTIQGKVNVSVEGPRGLILTGDHTSLGFFAMTNNARVQITSGGWAGTNVFLGGGAELIVAGTPFIQDAVLDVETASGTTKYILPEGVVQQVRTLIVDGEERPAGLYVAEEGAVVDGTPVGFISGRGAINVLGSGPVASDGVWDGGAGDSDISFLTAENWEGNVVPEHDLGLVNVTFATGSSTNCAVPGAISVNGGVFTADRHFRLSKTSASSVFGAAGGGLSFPDAAAGTAWTNTFIVPYRINAAQTWNVGVNRTVVFDEPVTSAGDGAVVVQGGGEVMFNAANTYAGALRLEAGTMRFATPAAFGGAEASFTVNGGVLNGATAWFPKGEISVPIAMDRHSLYPVIEFPEGETVVLNGAFRLSGNAGEGGRIYLRNGSELVFAGGVSGHGYLRVNKHPAQTGTARIVVTNTPTSNLDYAGDTAGVVLYTPLTEFVLAVTNCLPGRLNVLQKKYLTVSGGWARCAVTNALKCEATFGPVLRMTPSSDGTGVFDLDGYDQEVWRVEGGYNASQKTVVKSAKPAVLSVVGSIGTYVTDQETNCGADFQGLVTLRRAGAGTTTLRGISSTAGRLVVESGKVEFAGVGAMTNLLEVAVSGGELAIDTAARIGKGADFRLSGGTVKISSGVEQHCKWLYVPKTGGTSPWRRKGCGRYTSATCEYISGDGAIVVDGDGSGVTIIFK